MTKTWKMILGSRRGMACVLATLLACAPMAAEAGQNGSRVRGGSSSTGAVRAVLDFEGDWTVEAWQMNSTVRVPTVCQTAPYIAGPGEVAVINIDGFIGAASNWAGNILELDLVISENGGNFAIVTPLSTLAGFASSVAAGGLNKRIALTEGFTYVFGAGFSVYSPLMNSYSVCRGVVTITQAGQ